MMNEAEKLYQIFGEKQAKQPYHINVIDELHANENAHSRILVRLLQYQKNNRSFILKSFLQLLLSRLDSENEKEKMEKIIASLDTGTLPSVRFDKDNIDCLISHAPKYAIIIENKIHWAVDQWEQIQRYIQTGIKYGIKDENIYVVYLTPTEKKVVADYSFTDQAKKWLNATKESTGRFLPMNYMTDILSWLEDTLLPSCTIGEEWLVSSLRQYIDHLKGMFGLRDSERKLWREMKSEVTAQALRDAESLADSSEEKIFMRKLISQLQRMLEECFFDKILNSALCLKGLRNPGGWYPDFGGKWASIEATGTETMGIDLEGFEYGIASRKEKYSEEWSKTYWDTLKTMIPSVRRNNYYWLGFKKLANRDFCSEELLLKVLDESGPQWEQSPTLNKKAQGMVKEFSEFLDAVKKSILAANEKSKKA